LSRLDSKNRTPTPPSLAGRITEFARHLSHRVDAIIVMDQVDMAGTGVVNRGLLAVLAGLAENLPVLADSRRGLHDYPPLIFKMNAAELATLLLEEQAPDVERVRHSARTLAQRNRQPVFVTLAEQGLVGALPDGTVEQVPALPVRGTIDVVGAGDAVTANLAAALAAGAGLREALELAALASSIVIHQLGTTGTATVPAMAGLLPP
jgi:bifunctional ADP-heptose synthase (sugar kinase/adenylyltransferase)